MKKLINKLLDLPKYKPDVSQIPEPPKEPTPEPEPTLERDPFKPLPKPEKELPSGSQTYTLYSTPYPSEGHRIGELTVEWRLEWVKDNVRGRLEITLPPEKHSDYWKTRFVLDKTPKGYWAEKCHILGKDCFGIVRWSREGTTKEKAISNVRSQEYLELDNGSIINGADIKHMEPKQ